MDVVVSHSPVRRRKYFRVPGAPSDHVLRKAYDDVKDARCNRSMHLKKSTRLVVHQNTDLLARFKLGSARPHAYLKEDFHSRIFRKVYVFLSVRVLPMKFPSTLFYVSSISKDNIVYCRNGSIKHRPGETLNTWTRFIARRMAMWDARKFGEGYAGGRMIISKVVLCRCSLTLPLLPL